ncbi:hypothetical protein PtrSN002B_007654 [Pyrenophora tritici-repentis]|uniref:Hem-oxygenas-2 domain containing protein n=1 Tax=Pyrenophora tritici-repentis TaxID=45151 RepID=A0A2W1GX22_9PLEO|nr:heme-oxygenas-2 domain-containing protein [Pyrenophora tritici-repentis]KAF7576804.1 hypothetical protein PtrM4_010440 [Pyrenophora tritici-repentis]KAI1520592.1 hem-oxygenas-2 domain containing protein [Pyrenophora tritici-repentis]KAI1531824.1 hypothetical protein PtrSN001A_007540 [Pyrenophora tritici-repentis]KAI1534501.1 hypothetical protein PtrSN001C_007236 [Pyrenophora tritici-repentis]
MYTLQTTTAILIAFLAIVAYSEVWSRLAKGWSRRKDLETPNSPRIPIISPLNPPIEEKSLESLPVSRKIERMDQDLEKYKQLYHKLHNLEDYPDILPESRELLLSLLSSTITDALNANEQGILSVERFSRDGLSDFLKAKDVDVTNRWQEYLSRRKAGGSREIVSDKDEAKWWLKQAACVKYVDGAWLGHINKISTPFKYRHITKNAWQVMSEELGDGDLAKNHVHVYRELMKDIEAGLPAANLEDFVHPRQELTETRCWKAALAQLTISLFPHDFLPESLGFNMAYESLPLHLLKTVKELREVRLNPYYFELHISIDNADSGHAAMAMAAVINYIELVAKNDGKEAAHVAWKRVQAGYILAEGLPTTPESPSLRMKPSDTFPRTDTEAALIEIFAAKSFVAHKIHCNSRLKIGRRSLVDWLEPNAFRDKQWKKDFLHDLGNCKPWVIKGSSERSRLVKELVWEGKMFGSFTESEVEIVKAWIDDLEPDETRTIKGDSKVYFDFIQQQFPYPAVESLTNNLDITNCYPVLTTPEPVTVLVSMTDINGQDPDIAPTFDIHRLDLTNFLPLWFSSQSLLEGLPTVPVRAATPFGSAIIRVLRAQYGFSSEGLGVAGMDEVYRTDSGEAIGIVEALALGNTETVAVSFSMWMLWASMRWKAHRDLLIGVSWAFMEAHAAIATQDKRGDLLGALPWRGRLSEHATKVSNFEEDGQNRNLKKGASFE